MPVIINGSTGVSGVDGTASSPAIEGGDADTGIFFPSAGIVGIANNGTERIRVAASGQIGIGGANYGKAGQTIVSSGASSAPSWGNAGANLIATLATTSGTNPIASGLDLTTYKFLVLVFDGISHDAGAASRTILLGTSTSDDVQVTPTIASTGGARGVLISDLSNGNFSSVVDNVPSGSDSALATAVYVGRIPVVNASTSISLALGSTGNFDAGSLLIYGV